ncbi:hypothetical protein DXG01_013562 [Tephrocybe rancida]|nr:hypothetical protein DXG01_013562 [Tephrocybe rancida]
MIEPPTSRLPPIRRISSYSTKDLSEGLAYLRHIYNPEVQGSRRRWRDSSDARKRPQPEAEDDLDELRADAFERSYAIRWLTSLVALTEEWDTVSTHDEASPHGRERLVQEAASLLAICSGTAAAGVVVRDFVFNLGPEMDKKLKVHVKDMPIDNKDFGSVGAQTWGGACVLTETLLSDDPAAFGLSDARELWVLELGAGTGLVSLALGKYFETAPTSSPRTVVATDYYPSVLENLTSNIQANFPDSSTVISHFLDWSSFPEEPTTSPPFDIPFDIILGADVIYETQHAVWIKSCLTRLLRKPTTTCDPLFHLMIPLRATHSFESSSVDNLFAAPAPQDVTTELQLVTISKEIIVCDAITGRGLDQIEYAYYRIGWR